MTDHMAQDAATSMGVGAFFARCLSQVVAGRTSVADAIAVYEKSRMMFESQLQAASPFLNGWLWHFADSRAQQACNKAMEVELKGEVPMRSPNLYDDPRTMLECYGYDAASHADEQLAT